MRPRRELKMPGGPDPAADARFDARAYRPVTYSDLAHIRLCVAAPADTGTPAFRSAHAMAFDNSKIRSLVPGWTAALPLPQEYRRSSTWATRAQPS